VDVKVVDKMVSPETWRAAEFTFIMLNETTKYGKDSHLVAEIWMAASRMDVHILSIELIFCIGIDNTCKQVNFTYNFP
jgi:hypothetical protein